jgi:hypothetical protein
MSELVWESIAIVCLVLPLILFPMISSHLEKRKKRRQNPEKSNDVDCSNKPIRKKDKK